MVPSTGIRTVKKLFLQSSCITGACCYNQLYVATETLCIAWKVKHFSILIRISFPQTFICQFSLQEKKVINQGSHLYHLLR